MIIDLIVFLLFAVSTGMFVIWLSWSKITRSQMENRIRKIDANVPQSNNEKLISHGEMSSESWQIKKSIIDAVVRFTSLSKDNADLLKKLKVAGFRSREAINNYIVAKATLPIASFLITALYCHLLFNKKVQVEIILLASFGLGLVGYFAPDMFIKNRITKRQRIISRAWPEAVDLLLISVEAGMSVEAAFRKTTYDLNRQWPELAAEFSITTAEMSYLQDRKQAFQNLSERIALDEVKGVISVLIQTERYGTSLGASLRVLAQESRNLRMRLAEQKASALPPKLTIPMIVFFMPILFTVIAAPAIIDALTQP